METGRQHNAGNEDFHGIIYDVIETLTDGMNNREKQQAAQALMALLCGRPEEKQGYSE